MKSLGLHSRRLERERSISSDPHCPFQLGAMIEHLRIPIVVSPLVGTRTVFVFPLAPPPLPGAHTSVSCGPPSIWLRQDHSLDYRQLSTAVTTSYFRYACCSASSSVRSLFSFVRSSSTVTPAVPVDDASSLCLAVSYDLHHGCSSCSSPLIAVYS